MSESWKARKMVPGKDTISTMALHYGTNTSTLIEAIRASEAEVIRADGHQGSLALVGTKQRLDGTERNRNRKVLGWADGQIGVDPNTTKLTKAAIFAVVAWKVAQSQDVAA